MSPIRLRFFVGFLASLLLAFAGFLALVRGQMGAPSAGSAWAATINARKLAVAGDVPSPRLLIVGGSGALFGLRARQLEATLQIPTRNLASHAALGTAIILDLARQTARSGDTILLVPEYELYQYGSENLTTWVDSVYLDYTLAAEPHRLTQLPLPTFTRLALRIPASRLVEGWRNRFHPPTPRTFLAYHPYDPANVDDFGDMTGHRTDRIPPKTLATFPVSEALAHSLSAAKAFREFPEFSRWAESEKIRLLVALPTLCDDPAYHRPISTRTVQEITDFWRTQRVPILNDLPTSLLPRDQFFDTEYHLTEEAAVTHTAAMARLLAPYFPKP